MQQTDVIIIGGGPAGLSAALMLGRSKRSVLLFDHGQYRNASSEALRGFITREGMKPKEFLALAREGLKPYPEVKVIPMEVVHASHENNRFQITTKDQSKYEARKLVMATGVVDILPRFEGARDYIGKGLYHCPYCDGWEHQGQTIVAYAQSNECADFPLLLSHWSPNITFCTDGFRGLSEENRARLKKRGIKIREEVIVGVKGKNGRLSKVLFEEGEPIECDAMFFNTTRKQSSYLARALGCKEFQDKGCELDNQTGRTSIQGLYVIGDASKDYLQVIVAAAEGSQCAISINKELLKDDGIIA